NLTVAEFVRFLILMAAIHAALPHEQTPCNRWVRLQGRTNNGASNALFSFIFSVIMVCIVHINKSAAWPFGRKGLGANCCGAAGVPSNNRFLTITNSCAKSMSGVQPVLVNSRTQMEPPMVMWPVH